MGRRLALLVATDTYSDSTFRRLRAPENDVRALAAVLADKAIGEYEVLPPLHNSGEQQTRRAIHDVLADARRDDLVLLYFSGHGIKDDAGQLYLPCTETQHNRLASTAIEAQWIRDRIEESRCRSIMVWLDCCYAGAFPPGAAHRAGGNVDADAQLGGDGRVVMTSSSSLEYAYEITGEGPAKIRGSAGPSVFTSVIVDGLRTGDADRDGDGEIDSDELFDYVRERIRDAPVRQTPTQQSHVTGKLRVARSVRGSRARTTPAAAGTGAGAGAASAARQSAPPFIRRLFGLPSPPGSGRDDQLTRAAAVLARTVESQWLQESKNRWGERAEPIVVRWSSTARAVEAPPASIVGPAISGRPTRIRLHGDFHEIADKFGQLPRRQLVILGPAGSGKTVIAIQMLLGLIARNRTGDPVPVLLPVSTWNPHQESAYEWMARRLAESYPALADTEAFGDDMPLRLLTGRRVIPVLDGLDEMPESWRQAALVKLNQAVTDQAPFVLTCRSDEYEAAVEAGGTRLAHAAVVELQTPAATDIVAYLRANFSPDDHRWNHVCDHLQRHPEGPLPRALSTPLMVNLAVAVYASPAMDPAELTDPARFPDQGSIEAHLLDAYVDTRLDFPPPNRFPRDRAWKWLTFLARHLDDLGTRELEWWRISQAVPRWLIMTLVAAMPTMFLVVPITIADFATLGPDPRLFFIWAIGLAIATVFGRSTVRGREQPGRGSLRAVALGMGADLGAAVGLVSIALSALLVIYFFFGDPAAAYRFTFDVMSWVEQAASGHGWLLHVICPADMIIAVTLIPNLLAVAYEGMPRRSVLRMGRLASSLGFGLIVGAVVTAPATVSGILYSSSWLWAAVIVALALGVFVGLGRWLAAPVDERAASTPLSVFRDDRRALIIFAAAVIVAVTVISVAGTIFFSAEQDTLGFLILSPFLGFSLAVLVVFLSGNAWITFCVARIWLALRGKIPWRFMPFLAMARYNGILRQVGPAYQFIHALLQDRLTEHDPVFRAKGAVRTSAGGQAIFKPRLSSRFRLRVILPSAAAFVTLAAGVFLVNSRIQDPVSVVDVGYTPDPAMALNAAGDELATSNSGVIDIRNLMSNRVIPVHIPGGGSAVNSLSFSADGKMLIAEISGRGNNYDMIVSWNVRNGNQLVKKELQYDILPAGVSTDGKFMGAMARAQPSDGWPWLAGGWSMESSGALSGDSWDYCNGNPKYTDMAVSSSKGVQEFAVLLDDSIQMLKLNPQQSACEIGRPIEGNYYSVVLNPEGTEMAAVDSNGEVHLWDPRDGHPLASPVPQVENFKSVAFSSDGRKIAVASGREVRIYTAPGT